MIRTTPELVTEIINTNPAISLDPFILVASLLVDQIEENTAAPSEEVLSEIERWLAAHFYTVRDPRRESERAGDVWATFQSKVDLFLSTSHYGQMAQTLDTTGTLRQLSEGPRKKRTVGVYHVGTNNCEQ